MVVIKYSRGYYPAPSCWLLGDRIWVNRTVPDSQTKGGGDSFRQGNIYPWKRAGFDGMTHSFAEQTPWERSAETSSVRLQLSTPRLREATGCFFPAPTAFVHHKRHSCLVLLNCSHRFICSFVNLFANLFALLSFPVVVLNTLTKVT